jgi:hypothetical protein
VVCGRNHLELALVQNSERAAPGHVLGRPGAAVELQIAALFPPPFRLAVALPDGLSLCRSFCFCTLFAHSCINEYRRPAARVKIVLQSLLRPRLVRC